MKVLVIQTAFLGDVLLSIPLLERVKQYYPDSKLTLLCRKGLGEIFRELKICDEVIELNKKNRREFSTTLFELRKTKFDLLLCPHQSYRSAFMAYQIRAKIKIGFKEWWNLFIFNRGVKRNMDLPDALRQLSLFTLVDPKVKEAIKEYQTTKVIPDLANMGLQTRIRAHPRYSEILKEFAIPSGAAFIAPGSVWATKRWTPEGFRAVSAEVAKTTPVVFVGAPDEAALCEEISKPVSNSQNLAGKTSLLELLVLFTEGSFLLSNDSGAMHMASVAELPTVAIFGPTVPSFGYQPWQKRALIVENVNLKCRPCGKHGHNKCPIGTHECMTSISSEMVLSAIRTLPKA